MGFATSLEMKRFLGEDEGGETTEDGTKSPGGIIVETLLNIRTVSALTLEEQRFDDYKDALARSEENIIKESAISGVLSGLSILIQQWVNALQFWWGGWLVSAVWLSSTCCFNIMTLSLTRQMIFPIDHFTALQLSYQVRLQRLLDCHVLSIVFTIRNRSCNTRCVFLNHSI